MCEKLPLMPQPSSSKSAVCAVCLQAISTTTSGLLRTHGPLSARCLGSSKPPRLPTVLSSPSVPSLPRGPHTVSPSSQTLSRQGSSTPPSPRGPSPCSTSAIASIHNVRVLCCIPKSARRLCSSKLTPLLKDVVRSNSVEAWVQALFVHFNIPETPTEGKAH